MADSVIVAALLTIVPLLMRGRWFHPPDAYDEGIRATGSFMVSRGMQPWHDFYCIYGFGEYYLGAAVIRLFGHSLTSIRLLEFVAHAVTVSLGFLLSSRLCASRTAGAATAILLIPLFGCNHALSFVFALAGLLALSAWLRCGGRRRLLAAAVLLGVCAWFRHDLFVYVLGGCFIAMVIDARAAAPIRTADRHELTPHARERSVRAVCSLLVPAIVIAALGYAPFAARGAKPMWEGLVEIPARTLAARHRPLPPWNEFLLWPHGAHTVVFLLSALLLLSRLVRRRRTPSDSAALAIVLCGFGTWAYAFGRGDNWHQIPSLMLACVLLPYLVTQIGRSRPRRWARVAGAAIGVQFVVSAHILGGLLDMARQSLQAAPRERPVLAAAGTARLEAGEDLAQAVQYVREQTAPDDRIFVGLAMMKRVFVNNVGFYFLAERLPAVRDYHFDPLTTTALAFQQRMVADLRQSDPPLVVLWSAGASSEPNESMRPSLVTLLDDYIRAHYTHAAVFGEYEVLRRR